MAHLPKGQGVIPMPPFMSWLSNNIPAVYDNTMSYYEELVALIKYLQDTVVPAVNHNAEAITFLSNFVEHYFDNLDVQEEINNKLDQMAEDGTLQEIITAYIQANTAWCFDTVADMKLAENFINGSFAQTLGYHAKNDGGKALYKIRTVTNADVVDEAFIIALADDNLVAELILSDVITPEVMGAYGDNTHDDTTAVQKCLSNTTYLHAVLSKEYKITTPLDVPDYKVVDGGGKIYSTGTCFLLDGRNHLTIRDLKLYPQLHAIHFRSNTGHCNYNLLENIFCYGANTNDSKGLFIEVTNDYINEFTYNTLVFWNFKYGIYATSEGSGSELSKHSFNDCSTETSTIAGQYIKNGHSFTFTNCRHEESISCKFITEGTCNSLLIIGGKCQFNTISNADFSEGTNGQIIGRLRYAGIGLDGTVLNGNIVNGKVVPTKESINTTRRNVGSDLTINYGSEISLYYNFNSNTANHTLTLPSECFGGNGKINEFYVRNAKADYTSTVKIGSFTKVLPAGVAFYRFTLNTTEGGTGWFVEQITTI